MSSSIYTATLLVSIGLLAIAITVCISAVSKLGRAKAIAASERANIEAKRNKKNEDMKREILNQLTDPSHTGFDVKGLQARLKELDKDNKKSQRRLVWIRWSPTLLTVKWTGFATGGFFFAAAVLAAIALGYAEMDSYLFLAGTNLYFSAFWWIGSMIAIFLGVTCLCLTLAKVQRVAVGDVTGYTLVD